MSENPILKGSTREEIEQLMTAEELAATADASHLLLSRRGFGKAILGAAAALTLPVEEAAADGSKKATESAHQGAETRSDQPTTLMQAMGFYLREESGSYYLVIPGLKNGEKLQLQVANPTQFIDRDESGTFFEVKIGRRRYELRLQSREVPEYPKWINRPVWSVREIPRLKEDIPYVGPHISDEAVEKFPYQAQIEFLGQKIIAPISKDGYANLHTGKLSDKKLQLVLDPRTGKIVAMSPSNLSIIPVFVDDKEKLFIRFGGEEEMYELTTIGQNDRTFEGHRPQLDENIYLKESALPSTVSEDGQTIQCLPEEWLEAGFKMLGVKEDSQNKKAIIVVNGMKLGADAEVGNQICLLPATTYGGEGTSGIIITSNLLKVLKEPFLKKWPSVRGGQFFISSHTSSDGHKHYMMFYGVLKKSFSQGGEVQLNDIKHAIGWEFVKLENQDVPFFPPRGAVNYPRVHDKEHNSCQQIPVYYDNGVRHEDPDRPKHSGLIYAPEHRTDEVATNWLAKIQVGHGEVPVRLILIDPQTVIVRLVGPLADADEGKIYWTFKKNPQRQWIPQKPSAAIQKMLSRNNLFQQTSWPAEVDGGIETVPDINLVSGARPKLIVNFRTRAGDVVKRIEYGFKTFDEGGSFDDNLVRLDLENLRLD